MQYLECSCCQATPTIKEWKKYNAGIELLGMTNLPDEFEDQDDFFEFQDNSGSRFDCPECEEVNAIEDMQLY